MSKSEKARRTRHQVRVSGKTFPSTAAAFSALKLPMGSHKRFRAQLKAAGRMTFESGKRALTFVVVPQ